MGRQEFERNHDRQQQPRIPIQRARRRYPESQYEAEQRKNQFQRDVAQPFGDRRRPQPLRRQFDLHGRYGSVRPPDDGVHERAETRVEHSVAQHTVAGEWLAVDLEQRVAIVGARISGFRQGGGDDLQAGTEQER